MTTLTAAPIKEIIYDRETRDYAMYLDGEFVGYKPSYHAAEVELDRLAYEQLDRAGVEPEMMIPASELDAGNPEITETKQIPLTRNQVAIVDAQDYDYLTQWKWQCSSKCDAIRTDNVHKKTIRMHRVILNATPDECVDHINGNRLDNRRCNLRICTIAQNNRNVPARKGSNSQFKGVSWHVTRRAWQAYIRINNQETYLGLFDSERDAAIAHDIAARKHHGEFAYLNFPELEGNTPNIARRKTEKQSNFQGVSPTTNNKWRARIKVNGKEISLGSFTSELDAARAYDKAAKHYFGDQARLNFNDALDSGSSQDEIAEEYAEARPKPCATCGSDGSPCVDCNPAPADHNLVTPDPAECPDISAPQPVEELSAQVEPDEDENNEDDYQEGDLRDEDVYAPPFGLPVPSSAATCARYSTPPSLALWGPDTPECPKCGTRHDPVVACPVSVAVAPGAPYFLFPAAQAGDRDEKIIICIGGVSRWISASEVANLLTASTATRPVCPGCDVPLPGTTLGLCSACLRAEEAACYDQEWFG